MDWNGLLDICPFTSVIVLAHPSMTIARPQAFQYKEKKPSYESPSKREKMGLAGDGHLTAFGIGWTASGRLLDVLWTAHGRLAK